MQFTGPELNSEALGTMSSYLCLENRLSVLRLGFKSWLVAPARRPQDPKTGLGPVAPLRS